jgi:hypothetical protein
MSTSPRTTELYPENDTNYSRSSSHTASFFQPAATMVSTPPTNVFENNNINIGTATNFEAVGNGDDDDDEAIIPSGYTRPRRELRRQVPVQTTRYSNNRRAPQSAAMMRYTQERLDYQNFKTVLKKIVFCSLLAVFALLLYITTHEFGHALACAATEGHEVIKISILSVTIFERSVTGLIGGAEEQQRVEEILAAGPSQPRPPPPSVPPPLPTIEEEQEEYVESNDGIIRPIGDEYRNPAPERIEAPSRVGYVTCATVKELNEDMFLIERKEAWIKVSGFVATLLLQVIAVSVAIGFSSIIAASLIYPDTFFYAWKRYPNEVQEGFSVLIFNKVLRDQDQTLLPPNTLIADNISFAKEWDSKNVGLAYILTGMGLTLLLVQLVIFLIVTERKYEQRLDLTEERRRLAPLRIPQTRTGV